jgi:hypothetical protein
MSKEYNLKLFCDRVSSRLKPCGKDKTGLVKATGESKGVIGAWISGHTPKISDPATLFLAADFLEVNPFWLATGKGSLLHDIDSRIRRINSLCLDKQLNDADLVALNAIVECLVSKNALKQ